MHRFYCPHTDFNTETIRIIDADEIHHIKDVLRLKKGDTIFLFNTHGQEAEGIIKEITSTVAHVTIKNLKKAPEKKSKLILACAMPKRGKFELIIEKCTELGVDEIIPLKTERTEIELKGEREEKKLKRFTTIAINASKQCQRSTVPKIHQIMDLKKAISELRDRTTIFIPSLIGDRKPFLNALKNSQSQNIAILIGPEGDFTPKEYEYAWSQDCHPVTLGQTVLKVETAAICAIACASIYLNEKS